SKIYSSFWCRCKDTAMNMEVGEFKTHVGLNSFYEKHADKETTLRKLNNLIRSFNKLDGPYLLVTHYVNILAFTGLSTSSGGMVAYDLSTKASTHIKTNN
ncbi:MAG: histidine phosphatase family protein, partial [Rhodobacteraceae bacterium]|nr:histidine phosphatase family protein [Paracoccaceae bacterium]